jgi:hypothetical protein
VVQALIAAMLAVLTMQLSARIRLAADIRGLNEVAAVVVAVDEVRDVKTKLLKIRTRSRSPFRSGRYGISNFRRI